MIQRRTARSGSLVALAAACALVLVTSLVLSRTAEHTSANPATGFAAVSAGLDFTCGLTTVGGAKCWGYNVQGELGDGTTTSRSVPVDVLGLTSGVAAVSAGGDHACALTTGGAVKCWGVNDQGQLGDGTTTSSNSPVDVSGLASGVASVSAGGDHSCAVIAAGLKCWGNNYNGQLGDGTTTSRSTPVDVQGLSSGVASVSTGSGYTCAVTTVSAALCWGSNYYGQLGNGSVTMTGCYCVPTPALVSGLSGGVGAIAARFDHTCALTTSGGVKCWGPNFAGQLGNGTTTDSFTPVDVSGLTSGSVAVSAGEYYSCALTAGSGMKCWGSNGDGVLGTGSNSGPQQCILQGIFIYQCSTVPVDVVGLSSGVDAIAAGPFHSCVVMAGGVKCWGNNDYGQLGDGTITSRAAPVDVVVAFKGPTPTASPTQTPTPTPTPRPCPPFCGLDFSIGTDLLSGAGGTCDSSGTPTNTCNVPLGGTFNVNVYLNSLPAAGVGGITSYEATLQYTGLTATETKQSLHPDYWPGCDLPAGNFLPGTVTAICAIGPGQPASLYTGRMAAPEFTCTADGTITLVHGHGNTSMFDRASESYESSDELLTIHCVSPQASPGDTDGDGCPDAKEIGSDPMAGGARNFLNPWDYFDANHDGQVRIEDVVAVVTQYYQDQYLPSPPNPPNMPNPSYTQQTDRSGPIGPNVWNLGPPDGVERIDDVVDEVNQYFHDCP
jgi:alpha-tubulin suppressor-like RCC1 family protein